MSVDVYAMRMSLLRMAIKCALMSVKRVCLVFGYLHPPESPINDGLQLDGGYASIECSLTCYNDFCLLFSVSFKWSFHKWWVCYYTRCRHWHGLLVVVFALISIERVFVAATSVSRFYKISRIVVNAFVHFLLFLLFLFLQYFFLAFSRSARISALSTIRLATLKHIKCDRLFWIV